jgi:hypothetical protein
MYQFSAFGYNEMTFAGGTKGTERYELISFNGMKLEITSP